MVLADLNKGDKGIIKGVSVKGMLKNRLDSLGIYKGSNLFIAELSLAKSTIKIIVDNTMTALRIEEAKNIEVEKV